MPVIDVSNYTEIPFKHLSNETNLIDCFNLCRRILLEHKSIEVPYTTSDVCPHLNEDWYQYTSTDLFVNHAKKSGDWKFIKLKDIQPYDIPLMSIGSTNCVNHCGLYLGGNRILQTMRGSVSWVGVYGDHYKFSTVKIIRWKTL